MLLWDGEDCAGAEESGASVERGETKNQTHFQRDGRPAAALFLIRTAPVKRFLRDSEQSQEKEEGEARRKTYLKEKEN
jgi:hypothetical protein